MDKIKDIIGDYEGFFSDLLLRMKKCGIDITGMPMSHLLYRTTTIPEYEYYNTNIKPHYSFQQIS